MQEKILDTISIFLDRAATEARISTEVDMIKLIDISIGSIINDLVFGSKFVEDEDTTAFYKLKEVVKRHLQVSRHPLVMVMWRRTRWFKHLPIFGRYYREIEEMKNVIFEFFDAKIEKHFDEFDCDKEPQDFVDAFLLEMDRRREATGDVGSFE